MYLCNGCAKKMPVTVGWEVETKKRTKCEVCGDNTTCLISKPSFLPLPSLPSLPMSEPFLPALPEFKLNLPVLLPEPEPHLHIHIAYAKPEDDLAQSIQHLLLSREDDVVFIKKPAVVWTGKFVHVVYDANGGIWNLSPREAVLYLAQLEAGGSPAVGAILAASILKEAG